MRYEDLVTDPRAELDRLCAFLGEDFEESMLTPRTQAERLPQRQREVWHRQTLEAVTPSRTGRYADVLTSRETALVEQVAGSRLRRLGYPVGRDESGVRADPKDVLRYQWSVTSMRLRTRVLAARDLWLARSTGSVADRG